MGWEGINRRKFPRANYKCLVTVRKKNGIQTFTTQTENIGAGGLCFILPEKLEIFSHVDLVITLVNGIPPLKCSGTVVWAVKSSDPKKAKSNCYDIGIEFVDIDKENAARVKLVIEEIIKKDKI